MILSNCRKKLPEKHNESCETTAATTTTATTIVVKICILKVGLKLGLSLMKEGMHCYYYSNHCFESFEVELH